MTPQLFWLSFLQDTGILMQGYDHGDDLHVYFNIFLNALTDTDETDREREVCPIYIASICLK